MPDVTHRQYDELPVEEFILGFDTAATTWPALNATDRVSMVVRHVGGTAVAVALAQVDPVGRRVRWSPVGTLIGTAGTFTFVIRVTQADGRSYTHPETGTWNLIISPAVVTTDVADPA